MIQIQKNPCAHRPGKKKQHKHKLFGPDFPRTFLTLTPGWPRVKKFLPATGAAGKHTFWCGRPRFSARTSMTRRVVKGLYKKVCVDFLAPNKNKTVRWTVLGSSCGPCYQRDPPNPRNLLLIGCLLISVNCLLIVC